ncbi:hypothetical protein NARC_100032 [Candidatus Nitrosocosmicus arcticus]|uniref:Uncharacterized protein n=1 Tax=Candidatus Nitrosocosmicus arcticus TaxID=2035267 RepID=A0A557STP0_9ARCH|nr:hypothetical protein NARC_100032 [Candidatus Nitrosocosmicus arcticus]
MLFRYYLTRKTIKELTPSTIILTHMIQVILIKEENKTKTTKNAPCLSPVCWIHL